MENPFNPGDIVFHKVNNLRMVVLRSLTKSCVCRYISASGQFSEMDFEIVELNAKYDEHIEVTYQLDSKKASN